MTKLELLNLKLNSGEIVIFQNDNNYKAIGGSKDEYGNWRSSGWYVAIEECKNNIEEYYGYTQEELKKYLETWKYVESYYPTHYIIPVGTKVLILPNAEEECEKLNLEWNEGKEEMVGQICEIKEIGGLNYYIWNKDKSDYWLFPQTAFVIAWEDEDDEITKAIKLLESKGRIKDGKILI